MKAAHLIASYTIVLNGVWDSVLGQYSTSGMCHQSSSAKVILHRNTTTEELTILKRVESWDEMVLPNNVHNRQLSLDPWHEGRMASDQLFLRSEVSALPGLQAADSQETKSVVQRWLEEIEGQQPTENFFEDYPSEGELFFAWECSCFSRAQSGSSDNRGDVPIVYCPTHIDTCLRRTRWAPDRIPGCRNQPKALAFRRSYVMAMCFFFALFFITLLVSNMGRSVVGFSLSRCFPNYNDRVVDWLIRRRPERVRTMLNAYFLREQRSLMQLGVLQSFFHRNANGQPPPSRLVLKTKIFVKPDSNVDSPTPDDACSENGDEQCAICFVGFEDGDRVGLLKCDHIFHSDCLKVWLMRQNRCPLCKMENIAEPCHETGLSNTHSTPTTQDESSEDLGSRGSDSSLRDARVDTDS